MVSQACRYPSAVIALSVLDESPVPSGSTATQALRDTVALAQATEALGYRRYWLTEHHNTESLAGTAPEVLVAQVAAHTSSIRVGAGGILLPYYSSLKVAEVFRVLHTLHPGRIDLGLGRADGADEEAAGALRAGRSDTDAAGYRARIAELVDFLEGPRVPGGAGVRAFPDGPGGPEVWILGSSSDGAMLAAELGLPFSFAHFVSPGFGAQVMASYQRMFRPSAANAAPLASVAVSVVCAETEDTAERLARSQAHWRFHPEGARRGPLPSVEAAEAAQLSDIERVLLNQQRNRSIVGTPGVVRSRLEEMAKASRVSELVVRTVCHDPSARLRSYELLAREFDLVACSSPS